LLTPHPESGRELPKSGYRLRDIGSADLRKLASAMGMGPDTVTNHAREMCTQMPNAADEVAEACARDGLARAVLDRLVAALVQRAANCGRGLT
jgi:hypothetical protein